MKRSFSILLAVLGVAALVLVWGIGGYNSLVRDNEDIDGQWAQVENQFQRRYDLIPNLVATVKGYAQHEEDVFKAVADARAKLGGAGTVDDRAAAASEMESAISRLLVVVERYPELKADAQFARLMDELSGTENRLTTERMRYNEKVRDFNARVKQFPTVILARIAGFSARNYFEASPGAHEVPPVDFTK